MKKILLAGVIMAAGCGKVPPVAKEYRISQQETVHELSFTYAVKDPAANLYSQVVRKSDTDVAVTGEGIFADVNLKKHFKSAMNDHFLLSLAKQADGKVIVKVTPGTQAGANKGSNNAASFEVEFVRGSFEDFKAGKDIALAPTAKGRETLARQVADGIKTALSYTARHFAVRLDKQNKKYDIGEVRIDKIAMGDCKLTGNAKKLEFTPGPSEIDASVIISVKE